MLSKAVQHLTAMQIQVEKMLLRVSPEKKVEQLHKKTLAFVQLLSAWQLLVVKLYWCFNFILYILLDNVKSDNLI